MISCMTASGQMRPSALDGFAPLAAVAMPSSSRSYPRLKEDQFNGLSNQSAESDHEAYRSHRSYECRPRYRQRKRYSMAHFWRAENFQAGDDGQRRHHGPFDLPLTARPLPGRHAIVLSRSSTSKTTGALWPCPPKRIIIPLFLYLYPMRLRGYLASAF